MLKKLRLNSYEDLQDILELTPQKGYPFHCRGLEAKVQSQEIPGVTGKFGFGVQNKVGQRLTEFCHENELVVETPFANNTRDNSTHVHQQMVSTEIRLIIFFAAKDGEILYSPQKQDWEMNVVQIMNTLLKNSDLN